MDRWTDVVTRGLTGTGLLDTESNLNRFQSHWATLRDTLTYRAASPRDNLISIHLIACHLNESGKRFLLHIASLS